MFSTFSNYRGFLRSTFAAACLFGCDTTTTGVDPVDASVPDAGASTQPSSPGASAKPSATATAPRPTSTPSGSSVPTAPSASLQPDVDAAPPTGSTNAGVGSDSGPADAATPNDAETPDNDAGSPGDFSGVEEIPLLERAVTGGYDCTVSTPATLLDVLSGFDGALAGDGDSVWYARGETPNTGSPSLELSKLNSDATLTAAITLGTSAGDSYYSSQIIATPNGLLIFSLQYGNDGPVLQLAKTSSTGVVTRSAAPLDGLDGRAESFVLAVGKDNIGLLWNRYSDTGYELYYVTLDLDGVVQGTAELVKSSAEAVAPSAITATSEGYLFSYIVGYMPADLIVQAVDAAGTLGPSVPLANSPEGFPAAHSMLTRGDEVLLAWSDTGGTWLDNDLNHTTRLSRVDLTGERVAKDVRVQSPVTNQEVVTPKLLKRGNDVGVLWSEGSVIYICAGCMPDNHLRFVLLDGATLAPTSDAVTLTNPATEGGLINPSAVWQGEDLSVEAAVGYHVSGEGAAGTITCTAQ
jgi:hypothetical protein